MSDTEEIGFWSGIPAVWKVLAVFIAVGSGAVSLFSGYDSLRDRLVKLENSVAKANLSVLPHDISKLESRIEHIDSTTVKLSDLLAYVDDDELRRAMCIAMATSDEQGFIARRRAYEELIKALQLAEYALVTSEIEDAYLLQITAMRAEIERRKDEAEQEISTIRKRIQQPENC